MSYEFVTRVQPYIEVVMEKTASYGMFHEKKAMQNILSEVNKRLITQEDKPIAISIVDSMHKLSALLSDADDRQSVQVFLISAYFVFLELGIIKKGHEFEKTDAFKTMMGQVQWDKVDVESLYTYDADTAYTFMNEELSGTEMPFGILTLPIACYLRGVL